MIGFFRVDSGYGYSDPRQSTQNRNENYRFTIPDLTVRGRTDHGSFRTPMVRSENGNVVHPGNPAVSFSVTEENRSRLEILKAFGLLDGSSPTRDQIVNESMRLYFMQVYDRYSERADANDYMLRMMEEVGQRS